MNILATAWLALAPMASVAQDEPTPEFEIIVDGELEVEIARKAVASELKQRGYLPKKRKKNYILFRHPQDWKGEIRLYNDGGVRMKRQPIQLRVPDIPALGKGAALLCLVSPTSCIRARGQTVSRRKFMGVKVRTLEGIRDEVQNYTEAISNFHTDQRVAELPDALARLWEQGVPMSGLDVVLATPMDRKAEMLRFWESRTENAWGKRVRATTEVFIREVVQNSDTPFTDQEIERFNRTRKCKAALNLERPWSELETEMSSVPSEPSD